MLCEAFGFWRYAFRVGSAHNFLVLLLLWSLLPHTPPVSVCVQAHDIDDFEDLHAFPVRTPDSVHDWEDDDAFARLRLQGKSLLELFLCQVYVNATTHLA